MNGEQLKPRPASLSGRKQILAACLLIFMGLGMGIVALEFTVRLFFPVSDFLWQWDPVIGMKLIPDKRGRAVQRHIFDTQIQVNSVGFRDREHTLAKPSGVRRIVLLGDSFLEAIQVPFEQSVSSLLERRFNERNEIIEVINFGVSGFGTAREYLTLREYGLRYKPDLVLLFFVGNDVSDNSRTLQGLPYVPYPQVTTGGDLAQDEAGKPLFTPFFDRTSRLSSLGKLLKDNSKGYRFIREMVDNAPALNHMLYRLRLVSTPPEMVNAPGGDNFGFYEIYRLEPKPVWGQAWRLTEELMLAARDLAAENNAKFGVVLIPAYWEVDPQRWEQAQRQLPAMRSAALDLDYPSKRLTTFLTEHKVPVFNLLPSFRKHAPTSPPLYLRSDAHWTIAGHSLAADLLAEPVAALLGSGSETVPTY